MDTLKLRENDDEKSVSSDSASVSTGTGDRSSRFGDGSTSGGGTDKNGASSGGGDQAQQLRDRIISSEEKLVRRARIFVLVAVVISAVAVSTAVYFFSTQSDYTSFTIGYEGYATNMLALFKWEVQYNFGKCHCLCSLCAHLGELSHVSSARQRKRRISSAHLRKAPELAKYQFDPSQEKCVPWSFTLSPCFRFPHHPSYTKRVQL